MIDWQGKRVVIVGLARQGLALARYLAPLGCQLVLNDRRPAEEMLVVKEGLADLSGMAGSAIEWVFGGHPLEILDGADMVFPSGGVSLSIPLLVEASSRGILLSNDSQVFLETTPCPVIGITGSAGKTTTTTLVGRMARAGHQAGQVWVGGNIGDPLISHLDEIQPGDLAVMELSSFQLEIMTLSPGIAAVLNITPNHLDRHTTMKAYTAAKTRLLEYQAPGGVAVLGHDDPGAWSLAEKAKGQVYSFGLTSPPAGRPGSYLKDDAIYLWDGDSDTRIMSRTSIGLRGEHNLLNVLAACSICAAAGLPVQAMQAGVEGFMGVPHRLELVRNWRGADWYNDSIATAPERSMAAIRSFDEPLVLLAGGRDKNLPWDEFAELVRQRVDHLILFGESKGLINRALSSTNRLPVRQTLTIQECRGLKEAVQAASQMVEPGDVVLFSPGGTSFDEFFDFEERGEAFKQWVMELQ
jgi:UDP-N-acetylmuramoylalanine--D-glutamate ligase